jgi:hypothetical protein
LTLSARLPRYDHTAAVVASAIMPGILLAIALVVLAIMRGRRGR